MSFISHISTVPRFEDVRLGRELKASVLLAQAIFGILGAFFTVAGIMGQLTYRPSYWHSGPQPIVMAFIGLPLLAITAALHVLHKRDSTKKELQIAVRCPECGHLNGERTKFCGECGGALNPTEAS